MVDDPSPPPVPPEKAAAVAEAQDLPRGSTQPAEAHTHESGADSDTAGTIDWVNDPDVWVCVGPGDIGHARIIHGPSESMLLAMRDVVIRERAKDPSYMPTVEYPPAPEGCEPIEGKGTLEDFHLERSLAAVLNPDGSIKSEAELAAQAESRP